MPRAKIQFIEKTVHLHIRPDQLSVMQKHQLIVTLKHLFKQSSDAVGEELNTAFMKAGIDDSFPLRSAHSTFINKNNIKPVISALDNHFNIHIVANDTGIKEGQPKPLLNGEIDKRFKQLALAFIVKSSQFPLWHQQNQALLSRIYDFMNDDVRCEDQCINTMFEALTFCAPKNERDLIEPTKKWARKHISNTGPIERRAQKLFTVTVISTTPELFNEHNEYIGITILVKPKSTIGYIPLKLDLRKRTFFDVEELERNAYQYTLGIKKKNDICTVYVTFTNINIENWRSHYAIKFKQNIFKSKSPFAKKVVFQPTYLWDDSLSDGDYVIAKNAPLLATVVDVTAVNGYCDPRNVELTLRNLHQRLSAFEVDELKNLTLKEINDDDEAQVIEVFDV